MRHDQFEHVIRAAGAVLGVDEVIVIGSQAILGSFLELPPGATMSMEADIVGPGGQDDADKIDGVLGELSPFYESFGIYADGVGPDTATLPHGWSERLVDYANPNTNGVTARCLEPHDLLASKLYAGRDKDLAFSRTAIDAGLVDVGELRERIRALPLPIDDVQHVMSTLSRVLRDLGR